MTTQALKSNQALIRSRVVNSSATIWRRPSSWRSEGLEWSEGSTVRGDDVVRFDERARMMTLINNDRIQTNEVELKILCE